MRQRWDRDICVIGTMTFGPDGVQRAHRQYDRYRMMVIGTAICVRLARGGVEYARRFLLIVEAARKRQQRQFIIDGEAVLLVFHGTSDFDGLHSGKYDEEVRLYAFDILALDGEDLKQLPLSLRKQKLRRLLCRSSHASGIFAAPFDHGDIGPDLFKAACQMGLMGIVSKRADRPYHAGRSRDWIKVKNRKHPAYRRVQESCTHKSAFCNRSCLLRFRTSNDLIEQNIPA